MLGELPRALASAKKRVLGGRFVNQIRHPGVPARFDLASEQSREIFSRGFVVGKKVGEEAEGGRGKFHDLRAIFLLFVIDPSGAHCTNI